MSSLPTDKSSLSVNHHSSADSEKGKDKKSPKKKTGRWTQSEHEMFVLALRIYGREWKKIAEVVKTRTPIQIRTHAQKYLKRLNDSDDKAWNFLPHQQPKKDPASSNYNSTNTNSYFAAGNMYSNFVPMMNNSAPQVGSSYFPEAHLFQNTAYHIPSSCNLPVTINGMRRYSTSREVDAAQVMLGLRQWIA